MRSKVPRRSRRADGGRCHPVSCADLSGTFVAEVGVGIVHLAEPPLPRVLDPAVAALHQRLKAGFDPTGRLNPGRCW